MDDPALTAQSGRDPVPFLALAGLILLPFVPLALFGSVPATPDQSSPPAIVAEAPDLPDLPAGGDDTIILSQLSADDAQAEMEADRLRRREEKEAANARYHSQWHENSKRVHEQAREKAKERVKAEGYMKAAGQGQKDAQCSLGFMYLEGKGVEQSDEKAVEWYTKAAKQGQKEAQYKLGLLYKNGTVLPLTLGRARSRANAVIWLTKAAEQGVQQAADELKAMEAEADAQAVALLEEDGEDPRAAWEQVMMTKHEAKEKAEERARREAEEKARREAALMQKHGVGTVEEARRKEAEEAKREKEIKEVARAKERAEQEAIRAEEERERKEKAEREAEADAQAAALLSGTCPEETTYNTTICKNYPPGTDRNERPCFDGKNYCTGTGRNKNAWTSSNVDKQAAKQHAQSTVLSEEKAEREAEEGSGRRTRGTWKQGWTVGRSGTVYLHGVN